MSEIPAGLRYLRTFPDFELGNVAATEVLGLRRIQALLEELGSPHLRIPVVHLAGTKGKGSTAAHLASVLQVAGYRTGLFTQPHLVHVQERFQVDGVPIDAAALDALLLDEIRPAVERLERRGVGGVQQFEAQVALAFLHFVAVGAEVVVLETGLGGRLDATNVVPRPLAVVLTPIGFDHMQVLGTTLPQIAAEKAAIVKPKAPVIAAPQEAEVVPVFERAAAAAGTVLLLGGREWATTVEHLDRDGTRFSLRVDAAALRQFGAGVQGWGDRTELGDLLLDSLYTPLLGAHQAINAGAAVVTALALAPRFPRLTEETVRRGLAATRWPGRLQIISRDPLVVLDGAHTPESAHALAAAVRALFGGARLVLVLGMQRDKDLAGTIAPLAPLAAVVVATAAAHPRAASTAQVAETARLAGVAVEEQEDPGRALTRARQLAGPDGMVLVAGSLYLVGAMLALHEPERSAETP